MKIFGVNDIEFADFYSSKHEYYNILCYAIHMTVTETLNDIILFISIINASPRSHEFTSLLLSNPIFIHQFIFILIHVRWNLPTHLSTASKTSDL
jgi:hypothetical protein